MYDKPTDASQQDPHLETALIALEEGLSPVPPLPDGSKRPFADCLVENRWTWSPYQTTPATEEHVRGWYCDGHTGNGLACGHGDLEAFEFENPEIY
jgi:hypothetical protein